MKLKRILGWLILAALLWFMVSKFIGNKAKSDLKQGKMGGGPIPVSAYIVQSGNIGAELHISGSLLANESVELHPEATGRIEKIGFKEGERVQKGQLLIKIHDADLQAQLQKANAVLQQALAAEHRNKTLFEKGAVSSEQYEQYATALSSAKADIQVIQENIRKTELRAPFSGIIGLRNISEGAIVSPSTLIAALQEVDALKIEFSVPEMFASSIRIGHEITFKTGGQNGEYHARIFAIEPHVDATTRNVSMRARCQNADHSLLPGAFAEISLPQNEQQQALQVPTQSVIPILKGQKVYVVHADSVIEQKIETGIRNDKMVAVLSGLQVGDSVVCNGVMFMKKGAKVNVTHIENSKP